MYGIGLREPEDWGQELQLSSRRASSVMSAPEGPTLLKPIAVNGRLFSLEQRARMKGGHPRQRQPEAGRMYVAGVALPKRDSTRLRPFRGAMGFDQEPVTVTIAEMGPTVRGTTLRVVEHFRWPQEPNSAMIAGLRQTLWEVWDCSQVLVSGANGGDRVLSVLPPDPATGVALVGEARTMPALGPDLLAAVNAGLVTMYTDDGSPEHQEFWAQAVRARSRSTEAGALEFYVEPSTGDDGFLTSLALAVQAAGPVSSSYAAIAEPIPA